MTANHLRKAVLIVDDDPSAGSLLKLVLSRRFPCIELHCTTNPVVALDLFGVEPPDVLITDFRMPDLNGSQLARQMKAIKPAAKVIMLSGLSELKGSDQEDVTEAPFDFKLMKPVDFGLLFAALESCLVAT